MIQFCSRWLRDLRKREKSLANEKRLHEEAALKIAAKSERLARDFDEFYKLHKDDMEKNQNGKAIVGS